MIWGDTGIVVDGVPIPDSAGFQQIALAKLKPGDRVPHQIIDTIAFEGDKPVLATGSHRRIADSREHSSATGRSGPTSGPLRP